MRSSRSPMVFAVLLLGGAVALVSPACRREAPPQAPPAAPAAAAPAPAAAPASRVEVAVTEEGFVPSRIPAKVGTPLTLAVTRKAERTCATEIVFAGKEGKTDLPLGKTVEVTITPDKSGELRFGCGMGMMIGGVVAVAD